MKIQVDLPEDLNKELKKYRIDYNLKNLQEAVIRILFKKFFPHKDYISPKNNKRINLSKHKDKIIWRKDERRKK